MCKKTHEQQSENYVRLARMILFSIADFANKNNRLNNIIDNNTLITIIIEVVRGCLKILSNKIIQSASMTNDFIHIARHSLIPEIHHIHSSASYVSH